MANIKKIKINENEYDVIDATAARKGMYVGTCPSSASIGGSTVTMASSADKVVTVDPFPTDANNKPLVGTIIGVKYATSNTYKTDTDNNKPEAAHRINVNDTGFILIYYNNAALKSSTSANTLAAGYKNRYIYYQYDGTYWVWLSAGTDTNTTYSGMTTAEIEAGTGTTARLITPKNLRDYFYTEDEVDTLLGTKADSSSLATVATSGSYNDLSNKPTIPTSADINAAKPFIVTLSYDSEEDEYSANKTFAETFAAWQAGRDVLLIYSGNVYSLIESGEDYLGFMSSYVDASDFFKIYFNDDESFEMFEYSLINVETFESSLNQYVPTTRKINNNPLSADITLTASDVGALPSSTVIPSVVNNLTTTTTGSALDATQGKELSDAINNNGGLVFGKMVNSAFYKGVYSTQLSGWTYENTAQIGNQKKLYIDVNSGIGKIYRYEGSTYVEITGDYVDWTSFSTELSAYQEALVSGTNIKTLNGNSLLGSGDVSTNATIVTNSNTGSVSQALDPNKFYKFTGALTSLTLTLTSGTGLCIYAGKFTSDSSTACTVTLPSGVKLADGAPTVEAGGTYEFSIAEGLMLLVKEGV